MVQLTRIERPSALWLLMPTRLLSYPASLAAFGEGDTEKRSFWKRDPGLQFDGVRTPSILIVSHANLISFVVFELLAASRRLAVRSGGGMSGDCVRKFAFYFFKFFVSFGQNPMIHGDLSCFFLSENCVWFVFLCLCKIRGYRDGRGRTALRRNGSPVFRRRNGIKKVIFCVNLSKGGGTSAVPGSK
jgi:hypothetical protein